MSFAETEGLSLSRKRWWRAMSLIERSAVPPSLRARSAIRSVIAKLVPMLIKQQVIVAKMGSAHVPVEIFLSSSRRRSASASRLRRASEISAMPSAERSDGGRLAATRWKTSGLRRREVG